MRLHGLGVIFFFFFFNDTATTEIYTLSLHDALPISNELHFHNLDLRTLRYFERCRPASGGFVEIQHILDFSAGISRLLIHLLDFLAVREQLLLVHWFAYFRSQFTAQFAVAVFLVEIGRAHV